MLFVVTHLDAATRHAIEELHSATWLTVAFLPGGIALLVWGVLEIVRKPEWHICEKGIVRLSRANAKSLLFWQDISAVNVVRLMQYGRVVGFHLLLDKKRVYEAERVEIITTAPELQGVTLFALADRCLLLDEYVAARNGPQGGYRTQPRAPLG